ncbi:autotransporter outer membrane beta-barrel domain-containing protein, partial [Wohlfahrtiimonas chitiniclastica]|uniref:autotransporter family protein n=1 Tax=Wohlfahrtiimonas chitiniclastica TaxID=400946 RepID=UPI001BCC2FBD
NIKGGTANSNTIEQGGVQTITAGGQVTATTVNNGGIQNVNDGMATGNTIAAGGTQNIASNGVVNDSKVSGAQNINGGTANSNTIEQGGVQTITAGGQATATTVNNGGIQNVNDGTATGNTIAAGGTQNIASNGVVNDSKVSGTQNINGGTANNNTIEDGGKQIITEGGQANQTMVEKGGEQHVIDGIATTNTINTGGLQNIEHQGIAQDNNISGTQNVAGGTANNNTLYNGGVQNVSQGGQANTNVINNGGIQNVNDGTATGNTIAAGGTQNIGNAGHAIDSTIYGQQEVAAEGIITNTVVEGGLSYLHEGAQSTGNLTINNGGLLAVNATTVTDRTVDGVSIDSNSQMVVINQTGEEGFLTVGDMVNDGMVIINGFHSLNGESDTTRPFEDFVVVHADTLAGQGSILMHTDIGQQKGDLLSVGQLDAAAQQSLDVQNNAASDVTVNDRLTVVTTDSGGQAGQFSLSHAVEQGGYQFGLRQINEGKDWELYALDQNVPPPVDPGKPVGPNRPVLSSTADAAANSIVSTYLANFVDTQTLLHRMGELREGQNHVGLWGRAYGGKLDSFGNGLLSGFNMKYYSMQLGADYQVNLEHSRVYFGGAVSYLHGDQDFHKVANYLAKGEVQTVDRDGDGTLKNYNAYLYATYMTDQNFYVDTILKYGHMRSKFGVKDSAGANVSGHSSLNLYGLSAEVGQRFYLEGDQNFYVTPQVQLTYTHFGSGTYKASNGLNVKVKSRDSWLGRVGAELGYQFKSENPVNVYSRASYLKEFSNDGDFMLNHSHESYSMKGHWWQYEVGINAKIGQQHNVYFNVNYNKGQRFNQKQLNIGYRYEF